MLEAAHGICMRSKDCDFHNVQKTTRDSKSVLQCLKKLTPCEVKFKQKILCSYAPTISKRSRLDSDVVAKANTVTLSDDHSN